MSARAKVMVLISVMAIIVISIIGNIVLLCTLVQDRAEIAELSRKNDELQRSFDLYVETEQRANTLKKEEQDAYKDEQKAAASALDAAADWAHHILPDDIRGVLQGSGKSSVSPSGESAR